MSLSIVSVPIGNPRDISLRALDFLRAAEIIIGEEEKVTRRILKSLDVPLKDIYKLNEHSDREDIVELVGLCREKSIALISDCGTPVFCDPGSQLIAECRKENISVTSVPGASSLMTLLSLSSKKLGEFHFLGFPPAKTEERALFFGQLKNKKEAFVIMDTPYRMQKTLQELKKHFPNRHALMGVDLTSTCEQVLDGAIKTFQTQNQKGEFIILIYPQ